MCNLSKGVMEKSWKKGMEKGIAEGRVKGRAEGIAEGRVKGRAEGIETGILSSIKSLMETMGWTLDQAMAALKVPEADRQTYQNLLREQS